MANNVIYFLLFLVVVFLAIYWIFDLHKNTKLKSFFEVMFGLAVVFAIYSAVISSNTLQETRRNDQVQNFEKLSKDFLEETVKWFSDHPEMNYYYNELFGLPNTEAFTRNPTLENQITTIILSRLTAIIVYLQEYGTSTTVSREFQTRVDQIVGKFVKSPIFLEQWKSYKSDIGGQPIINKYMASTFQV